MTEKEKEMHLDELRNLAPVGVAFDSEVVQDKKGNVFSIRLDFFYPRINRPTYFQIFGNFQEARKYVSVMEVKN